MGSYFLGAWLAVLAVIGLRAGIALEAMFAPLALYLADTGTTLVRRVRRREIWHQPHRHHAYQRLHHGRGWSHARTKVVVAMVMVACSALGAVSQTSSLVARVAADVGVAGLLAGYLPAPSGRPGRPQPALPRRRWPSLSPPERAHLVVTHQLRPEIGPPGSAERTGPALGEAGDGRHRRCAWHDHPPGRPAGADPQ